MAGAVGMIEARGAAVGLAGDEAGEAEDAVLVARAKADPRAFATLYRRYVERIYRYCYRRLGSREAAEDATATVFAKALAALPAYRDGSFRGWLFAIAHNAIVGEFRQRAARPERAWAEREAEGLADPAPSPEEAALAAEARMSVLGVLPRLPEGERRVLELRLAGLSGPEIAAVLGRSHGSVRVAQFRAMARLRGLLEEGKVERAGQPAPGGAREGRGASPRPADGVSADQPWPQQDRLSGPFRREGGGPRPRSNGSSAPATDANRRHQLETSTEEGRSG